MPNVEHKTYCFDRPEHWRAGAMDQLEVNDSGLCAPSLMTLSRLPGTGPEDSTAALAFDPCGNLHWVRNETFEIVRALETEPLVVGRLGIGLDVDEWRPAGLAIGCHRLWLLLESRDGPDSPRLLRFAADDLQRLGPTALDRTPLAVCGDGHDGVWLVLGGDDHKGALAHIGPSETHAARIELPTPLRGAAVAVSGTGAHVVVLETKPHDPNPSHAWQMWVVDRCRKSPEPVPLRTLSDSGPGWRDSRLLLTIDGDDRVHVLEGNSRELWTLSLADELLARRTSAVPADWTPVLGLAARSDIALTGRCGVATLVAGEAAQPASPGSVPTYITPVLVSPEGAPSGWMRADLDVDLEDGAAIELSVAATRDPNLIEGIGTHLTDTSLSTSARLRRIDDQLSWMEDRTKLYRGGDFPTGRPLRFPLHEIEETHLWLRVRIHAASTRAPRVSALRVLYPNLSFTRHLPAVYQEDENAAKLLRRLLAVFESVIGDLDAELAELPRRIDPATAPDEWFTYLLSWLGLPTATELAPATQRELLTRVSNLLRYRGTRVALEALLRILVGANFSVTDLGEGPSPWTLPSPRRRNRGRRLGSDTLVLSQPQPGFRLECNAHLGQQALGYTPLDPAELFARRSRAVEIRVAVGGVRRATLEPLLRRYLPYFIPAHCHYQLRFVPQDDLRQTLRLDEDLRIERTRPPRLGDDARLGCLELPAKTGEGVILGRSTFRDGGLYLS